MKAYEAIKILKADRKEFLEQYGIKSHMSNIPAELEAELFGEEKKTETEPELTETVDSSEGVVVEEPVEVVEEPVVEPPVVVEEPEEECPVDLETLKVSLRGAGNKSPYYKWKHLSA